MTPLTAFILGCWVGVGMLGAVILIVYWDDIWPE